jgi:hypothetical protein
MCRAVEPCWSVWSTDAPFAKSKWTMVSLLFSQAMNSGEY